MVSDILFTIMEVAGTVAFAVSGALVAIASGLDLFGVITVGCITAVGGGAIRDLLIGRTPPQVFANPKMMLIALVTTIVVFIVSYINAKNFKNMKEKIDKINIVFDAIGLAAFSVTGVEIVRATEYGGNAFLAITLGLITGVGGGILRDVLVNEKPYVLTKHVYAVASILGCCIYYFILEYSSLKITATFTSAGVVVLIRMLAAKYRWQLPKIKFSV